MGIFVLCLETPNRMHDPNRNISAVMITYNEVEHIDAVIENLEFVDEMIIVDSFSNDGTVEAIGNHPKVTLIQRPFKNYTDQKAYALSQASNDWVLFLDADERLTDALREEIVKVTQKPNNPVAAYYFYRTFMFKKERLRFSGWQTDKNYRLFRKSKVHFKEDLIVHETLVVNGKSASLKHKLIHFSYKDYEDYKGKMLKYGQMKARHSAHKNVSPNFFHFYLKPGFKFLYNYICRLGVLDGKKGVTICYLNALGVYARYKELERLKQQHAKSTESRGIKPIQKQRDLSSTAA